MGPLYWFAIGLEIRLHKQVTHTQRHMNNAWSEMVSSTPCIALYSSWSPWLLQTIWDNSAPTTDRPCRLITTLLLLVLHVYDYEQPNAPLPTIPLCEYSKTCNTLDFLSFSILCNEFLTLIINFTILI